ncbi:MAG TPA: aspartate aminotransferase family protein, partial [Planctomycetaceae bacterium]|nr:aspartate aminotransferase family protein [Planctomycetaceae bacterium]
LRPGMHAATFGGNPLAARAGIATIEMIEENNLLERTTQLGESFRSRLQPLLDELPSVVDLRICGLMIGLELNIDATPIVQKCMEQGLLINCTQGNVIRLLPAMTLTDKELQEGCDILTTLLREN